MLDPLLDFPPSVMPIALKLAAQFCQFSNLKAVSCNVHFRVKEKRVDTSLRKLYHHVLISTHWCMYNVTVLPC